ncbi:MAG: PD-(D/E)XK nuclease family protein [Thermoplasmatota archaeon]
MFLKGPRCSSTDIDQDPTPEEKDSLTTELTQLAFNSQPKNTNKSPHEIVEEFFLINDSTTVCTELPVFINPKETEIDVDEPITGHIDLIQIRYKDLYVLDYKPNLNNPKKHGSQLQLYKKAIQKRTSIPKDKIHTAVFNQHGYFEFE